MNAFYDTPYGRISVEWQRVNGKIRFKAEIPEDIPGWLELPDGSAHAIQKKIETDFS